VETAFSPLYLKSQDEVCGERKVLVAVTLRKTPFFSHYKNNILMVFNKNEPMYTTNFVATPHKVA
jgi:hypothetical protein